MKLIGKLFLIALSLLVGAAGVNIITTEGINTLVFLMGSALILMSILSTGHVLLGWNE